MLVGYPGTSSTLRALHNLAPVRYQNGFQSLEAFPSFVEYSGVSLYCSPITQQKSVCTRPFAGTFKVRALEV